MNDTDYSEHMEEDPAHITAAEVFVDVCADIEKNASRNIEACIGKHINRCCDEVCRVSKAFSNSSCKAGCSFCCTLYVDVFSGEANLIAANMKAMPNKDFEAVRQRIQQNSELENDGIDEYIKRKTKCAFLADTKKCMIYKCRPLACRLYNSLNVKKCMLGVGNPDAGIPRSMDLIGIRNILSEATGLLYGHFGIDATMTSLHRGVLAALNRNEGR